MVQDRPPQNRRERRAQARTKPQLVRQQTPNPKQPQEQVTGIGDESAETAEEADLPPLASFSFPTGETAPKGRGRPKSANKADNMHKTLVSYYALAGLGIGRFDQIDGQIIMASADEAANAWIAAGKADPRIQRALEIVTVAGPYTALIWVHAQIIIMIMDRHGANPLAGLFSPPATPQSPTSPAPEHAAPLPYIPLGANAPTEATPPPQYSADTELGIPDEGLPAEIDIALREMARSTGRPYAELRQEALVEISQLRLQRNGRAPATGALGVPIAKE